MEDGEIAELPSKKSKQLEEIKIVVSKLISDAIDEKMKSLLSVTSASQAQKLSKMSQTSLEIMEDEQEIKQWIPDEPSDKFIEKKDSKTVEEETDTADDRADSIFSTEIQTDFIETVDEGLQKDYDKNLLLQRRKAKNQDLEKEDKRERSAAVKDGKLFGQNILVLY